MWGFLTGAGIAGVLAAVTFLGLNAFTVTSIERVEGPSIKMEGVSNEFYPDTLHRIERIDEREGH